MSGAIHVSIRGRVQGVGFRAFVEEGALQRGVRGWVRNRRDGSVEAMFSGEAQTVAGMIEACRRGPFGARVTALDQREASAEEIRLVRSGDVFSVLPTI